MSPLFDISALNIVSLLVPRGMHPKSIRFVDSTKCGPGGTSITFKKAFSDVSEEHLL